MIPNHHNAEIFPHGHPPFAFADESPWGRCLTQFLREIYAHARSQATLVCYRLHLVRFFSSEAGGTPPKLPDAYTREDVEAFLSAPSHGPRNRGGPVTPGTRNLRLTVLRSFYRFATSFTYNTNDTSEGEGEGEKGKRRQTPPPQTLFTHLPPTAGIRSALVATQQAGYRTLSAEEIARFFAAIPTDTVKGARDRALFLMYFWTARRRNEILSLRYGDIFEGTVSDGQGGSKSSRQSWLYRFCGKGRGGATDIAELPRAAKVALDHYLEVSGRSASIQAEDPLFVTCHPGASVKGPLSTHAAMSALKAYATAAGLDPQRVCIHTLRHCAAQQRYAAGEDIRSLQRLLRHKRLDTTDIYLRGLQQMEDAGARLLEGRFGHL